MTVAMELKVWREGQADPVSRGLAQLDGYLDGLGLATGWLVVFDQRASKGSVADRTQRDMVTSPAGREITLVRA